MSKRFYAVNRETGERWKPENEFGVEKSYLMLYDSGYIAVVKDAGYMGTSITPLDPKKWKVVYNESFKNIVNIS